jgi:pyruvate formate lyase activating enzyme
MHKRNRCIRCGKCVQACPEKAISMLEDEVFIDRRKCSLCGQCSESCPSNALLIAGKEMTTREILEEVEKDSLFYEESEGGITFSGGEPLLQIEFLNALLEECNDKGFRTAVDTSGYCSRKSIDRIKSKVDLFLYDIKTMDDKKHRKYTGVSNKPILENFRRLSKNGNDIWVRLPIVPKINDDEDNIVRTAEFILSNNVKQMCLLPYHRAGIEKYNNLSRPYKLKGIKTPSDQYLILIKRKLESLGLRVVIGGG